MTTKTFIIAILLVGNLLAEDRPKKDYPTQFFGSPSNMETILKADRVTACRLKGPRGEDGKPDYKKLQDFDTMKHYIAESAIDVPMKVIDELRNILKDPGTHEPDSLKACIPIYGVRFTFTRGDSSLTVNLCFPCEILVTAEGDKIVGGGSFDPAAARLMSIARTLFPNDEDLRDIR